MNKFKKLAVAAVSVVMAGTMAMSFTACGDNTDGPSGNGDVSRLLAHMKDSGIEQRVNALAGGWNTAKDYWKYLSSQSGSSKYGEDKYGIRKSDGSIDYTKYTNDDTTLNMAVGHDGKALSIAYHELGDTITMPDGITYKDNDLKPAWRQLGEDLNITFNDVWNGDKTSNNLNNMVSGTSTPKYADVDVFTTDLSVAVTRAAAGTSILNLADYLDYMPHFKAFLESNPVVYLSLLQAGMSTETGEGKIIYVAPYFDGNDDIERYCIMRTDWVAKLLDGVKALDSTTYKDACGSVAVTSFMDTTGKRTIESVKADGSDATVKIVKNYDAAKAAAADESKPLGAAYSAIAGAAYSGESGNIIDIMNAALATNDGATGAQLANLLRAYIDVCYQNEDGSAYFTPDTRHNLFSGYDACWDVDDLVALLRVAKTNALTLTGSADIPVEGIVPRSGQNDRTPDMVRLACQLYGVRGADSRYEYTYIDNAGNLKDARNSEEFFAAMARMNLLKQEKLIANYEGYSGFGYTAGLNTKGKGEAMMMYDYSQTQTLNGFYVEDTEITGTDVPNGYNFAPVVTPVSKWDVNADGKITDNEYFRFTESWRSTKTGGLAVNGAVKDDAKKLQATLQLIDYLYSDDGQIVSTFGPMAKNANGEGGFWYNEPAGASDKNVFYYKGVAYKGTEYKGEFTPTITDNVYNSFKGKTVNDWKLDENTTAKKGKLSFTSYARTLIGSTLPVGVKDQSFENQLTSKMGQLGANKVGKGLALGTIKGQTLDIKESTYWYTVVPTGLPIASNIVSSVLNSQSQNHLMKITGTGSGKDFYSVMNWVILNGFTKNYSQQDETVTLVK